MMVDDMKNHTSCIGTSMSKMALWEFLTSSDEQYHRAPIDKKYKNPSLSH